MPAFRAATAVVDRSVGLWEDAEMRLWFIRLTVSLILFALALGGMFLAGWSENHGAGWFGIVCLVVSGVALLATVVLVTADALPLAWQRVLLPGRLVASQKGNLPEN
jgi:hypothetical protein